MKDYTVVRMSEDWDWDDSWELWKCPIMVVPVESLNGIRPFEHYIPWEAILVDDLRQEVWKVLSRGNAIVLQEMMAADEIISAYADPDAIRLMYVKDLIDFFLQEHKEEVL